MSIEYTNSKGKVDVSEQAIATIVGATVSEVYGVLGMASQKKIKDGVADIFKKDNFTKGIIIQTEGNEISIEIHVVVLYGIKISEVAHNIQQQVKFTIEKMLDLNVTEVNIIIDDVRVDKSVK